MSLLSESYESCHLIDKTTVDDGYGGYNAVWVEGANIQCAIVLNSSLQAKIAEKQGVTALYTITTSKAVNLQFHDVIRRDSDNKVFRVTSDGDDNKTPASAGLDMREVSAEEYKLTEEVNEQGTSNS